jgi:hypothetical protein
MRSARKLLTTGLQALFWTAFVTVLAPHLRPIDAEQGPSLESLGSITGHDGHAPPVAP